MAYPTDLDSITRATVENPLNAPSHVGVHDELADAIEALEVKVGVDSSAVATSLDYLLKNASSVDPGHTHSIYLQSANNLSDLANASTARTNLGLVSGGTGDIWVEKAGDTMTGQLFIDGSANVIQQIIQGHSTQNANLTEWQNSSGTILGVVDKNGIPNFYGGTSATNLFIGGGAANASVSGTYNTALGNNAGHDLSSGIRNILIGGFAGADITTATNNICIGYTAGWKLAGSPGNNNVLIGSGSGSSLTGSSLANVAVGAGALGSAETCIYAVAIGLGSQASTTGTGNLSLGYYSAFGLTTGNNNVCLGRESGYNLGGGNNNVFIGFKAGYNETGNRKLYIETSDSATPLIYGEFDNRVVHINGKFLIKSTVADALTIGVGTAGIDYQIKVDGETNDLTLTYMEYEDRLDFSSPIRLASIKSGATQAGAGAAAGEVWKTASHETLPDNVLMIGV